MLDTHKDMYYNYHTETKRGKKMNNVKDEIDEFLRERGAEQSFQLGCECNMTGSEILEALLSDYPISYIIELINDMLEEGNFEERIGLILQ